MDQPYSKTTAFDAHWRRLLWLGLGISILVHGLAVLIFRGDGLPPSPFSAAGPNAGDDAPAGGDAGALRGIAIALPATPQPIPRPPEPIIVPDAEIPEPVEAPVPEIVIPTLTEATAAVLGAAGEAGSGGGSGGGAGGGRGGGGTAESGRFRVQPPSPRSIIFPPADLPASVRGKKIEVWVFVTEQGRVVADSTRIHPSTGDRSFDERLRRQAAQWVFEPARRGGRPVAEWFQYVIEP